MPFNPVNAFNFDKPRNQPSPYPFPTTYILAGISLISSLITFTILIYFSYYLRMDNVHVPMQFIFLIVVSIISTLAVVFTTSTHVFRTMVPRTSMIINGIVFIIWIAGLAIITSKIGSMVLGHACAMPMWITDMGVMVCRIYKALYSFIVIATAASGGSVLLDISISNEVTRRGMYREMKDDGKTGALEEPSPGLRRGFYTNNVEMKDSPDLGMQRGGDYDSKYEGDDDTTKLVGQTPDLSEQTPKL